MQLAAQGLSACTLTPRGSGVTFSVFPGGATVNTATNVLYVNEQGGAPWNIWSVDTTTGVRTVACVINGMSLSNVSGITWCPVNSTMYGVNSNLSSSQLFSINMSTGLCTPIGSPSSTCAGAVSISSSKTGTLFSIDIVSNNLYKVNRNTGVFTLVGSLGHSANYGQDAQFDLCPGNISASNNKLYWVSGTNLRLVDTTSGISTNVSTYSLSQVCTIGIFGKAVVGINNDKTITDVNVYPNPAKDMVNISGPNLESIKVFNVAGQELEYLEVKNSYALINVSDYDAGIYIVQVKTDKGFINKKITVTK